MPFDGFVTKCIAEELHIILVGGRIDKIQQPERDEIHLTVRNNGANHRLLISSNASAPRIHLTSRAKENPEKAPMFCMILRKHLGGGKVIGIAAGDLERVVEISVESANELGDLSIKTLIAEIMGKHSNIILLNEDNRIIDSLVHVDQDMSGVREVMPARLYAPPPPQNKIVPVAAAPFPAPLPAPEPLPSQIETDTGEPAPSSSPSQDVDVPGAAPNDEIIDRIASESETQPMKKIGSALLDTIMGASPLFCRELCFAAGVDHQMPLALVGSDELGALRKGLAKVLGDAFDEKYAPCVTLRDGSQINSGIVGGGSDGGSSGSDGGGGGDSSGGFDFLDFYCWQIRSPGAGVRFYDTMSEAVDDFYYERARAASLSQRKAWLVKLVAGQIARCNKKFSLQQESLRNAADYETYKLYGELITANIYSIAPGAKSARVWNYYSETEGDAQSGAQNDAEGDAEGDSEGDVKSGVEGETQSSAEDNYVDIELDGDLSPQANAQVFFRKYRKAASTVKNARIQSAETQKELVYLESVMHELEMSQNSREIDEIRQELASQKYVSEQGDGNSRRGGRVGPRKTGKSRPAGASARIGARTGTSAGSRKNAEPSAPHKFISSDGLTILVGKNNRQNDQITLRTAASNDIWLHARGIPGSHVVVKKQQGDIPDNTLLEAASLAARFSKARMGENVAVDYTAARHVRKPSGSKPGIVIYDNQRTLFVTPDASLPARLTSQ